MSGEEESGVFAALHLILPQLPTGGIGTCGGAKGDIVLFGATVRLNPDYYPLLPKKISLSAVRIPFISEFPAPMVSRIYCWFK